MKIYAGEIYAFMLGGALSWIATYLRLTNDKRAIARIKSDIELLSAYHTLDKRQYDMTQFGPLFARSSITDDVILDTYCRVLKISADKAGSDFKKVRPTLLAAEIIICERILGLTGIHAFRTLLRIKDLRELQKSLHDVSVEISSEFSN